MYPLRKDHARRKGFLHSFWEISYGDTYMRKKRLKKIEWKSVSIPKTLFERVDKIWRKWYGYSSVAEYCRDAIRRKLQLDEARMSMEKDEEEH